MSRNNEALLEEARLLLAWYLTDQLSAVERELVDDALSQYPSLHEELQQEEQLRKVVCQHAKLLELSALDTTPQRLDNLLQRIGQDQAQQEHSAVSKAHLAKPVTLPVTTAAKPSKSTWGEWLQNLFNTEWLTPANAVLAGLLVCQVGVGLLYLGYNRSPSSELAQSSNSTKSFELASYCNIGNISINLAPKEQLALVEFKDSTTVSQIRHFLEKNNMSLLHESPGNTPNLFMLKFQTDLMQDDQIASYLEQIKQSSTDTINFLGKTTPEEACN